MQLGRIGCRFGYNLNSSATRMDEQSSVGHGRMYDRVRYGRMAEQSSVGRRRL